MQRLTLTVVGLAAFMFPAFSYLWSAVAAPAAPTLARLPDGLHQFCSQPEPKDWRLGAGVCLWFRKQSRSIVGYYGYPHSDHLIDCISGQIETQRVVGEGLILDWTGDTWQTLRPHKAWDREGHLIVNAAPKVHLMKAKVVQFALVQIRSISLNLTGFYPYSAAKVRQMRPPPQNCDLNYWKQQAISQSNAFP